MNINMDSFVSKLRQTVSQVAYQVNSSVSTIIPGNLIHREYELLKQKGTHGCPKLHWTIYDAVKRDSSSIKASLKDAIGPSLSQVIPISTASSEQDAQKQQCNERQLYSVFVFDKSQIDAISNKAERDVVLEHIKRGVTQLTRLRHPSVLTVHHPLEESRSSLAFVTEHVYGHLESIITERRKHKGNSKNRNDLLDLSNDAGPKDTDYQNDICELDDVQIKAGLLRVCDGLMFLHSAKMIHRNLCLENIFVDTNNTWKIGGFDFCCPQLPNDYDKARIKDSSNDNNLQIVEFNPQPSSGPIFPSLKTLSKGLTNSLEPNWSCSAPEHSNLEHVSVSSDVYSLGLIGCALLVPDLGCINLTYEYGLMSDTYKRGIMCRELADKLPPQVKPSLIKFMAINESSRPSLEDFKNLSIFSQAEVQAIRNLDHQFALDRLKKIELFDQLRDILPKLSHQVKVNRVAKSLFNEAINSDMLPYVLPNILIIAKDSTPSEFKANIFPNLKAPFRVLEPKTVPLLLLDHLAVLADRAKLCLPEFQQSAFTLIQYLLRKDSQMQDKCLDVLPQVRKYIGNTHMVQTVLPEINKLCNNTDSLAIRVKCLQCLCKLIDAMERSTIVSNLLPIVYAVPSREPEVVMASLAIVKTIVNDSPADLSKDIVANCLIPFMVPLMIVKDLNLTQFNSIVQLIKQLLDRVEREQRNILARKGLVSNPQTSKALVLDSFNQSKSSFEGLSQFELD